MTIRAYIRSLPGHPLARQRERCEEAGATRIYEDDQRAAWIRSLRPGDVAMIDRLALLAEPRRPGKLRPGADFAATLAAILARCAEVREAATGISSHDGQPWLDAVARAAEQVSAGRTLTPARARKIGERGRSVMQERSASATLARPEAKPLLKEIEALWMSPAFGHRDDAAEAINQLLERHGLPRLGSSVTVARCMKQRGIGRRK